MKQQFVITSRHTILQETENTSAVLYRATLKHVKSLLQYIDKPFVYGHSILTGSVFVLDDFVGYDKSPSHERDYGHGSDHRSP